MRNHQLKRRFPTGYACVRCNKKMLRYSDHPHAFGWKDYEHVECRKCHAVYRADGLQALILETEAEDKFTADGRWPADIVAFYQKKD